MEGSTERAEEVVPTVSDTTVRPGGPAAEGEQDAPVRAARKRSIWDDPMVRALGVAIFALIVLYLSTIVLALFFGFIGDKTPRTASEREVVAWEDAANKPGANIDQWQSFVVALIKDKQFVRAKEAIDDANARKLDQTQGQNMLYCLAELQRAQGDKVKAAATFEKAMKKMNAAYEKELKRGSKYQNWALAYGLHKNYYLAALARGSLYMEDKKWEEAVKMLTIFLSTHAQESGVLVDRGDAKAAMGDKKGAEADYREALKYIPDYAEALEGLKKIGVGE